MMAGHLKDHNYNAHNQWYAIVAYLVWGVLPLFWYALREFDALLIVLHRIFWSALGLALFIAFREGWSTAAYKYAQNMKEHGFALTFKAILISSNWLLYVWSVNHGYVLETSLGYFINPMISILLARIVLKERLDQLQWMSVSLISTAIIAVLIGRGYVPWIALTLSSTFAWYGLLAKQTKANPVDSFALESLICVGVALLVLWIKPELVQKTMGVHYLGLAKLMLCGVVTAIPLVLFAKAAQSLPLYLMGILQFISPALQFALGIIFFQEDLSPEKIFLFTAAAMGVVIFSINPTLRLLRIR